MRSGSAVSKPQSGETKPKRVCVTTPPSAVSTGTVSSGLNRELWSRRPTVAGEGGGPNPLLDPGEEPGAQRRVPNLLVRRMICSSTTPLPPKIPCRETNRGLVRHAAYLCRRGESVRVATSGDASLRPGSPSPPLARRHESTALAVPWI